MAKKTRKKSGKVQKAAEADFEEIVVCCANCGKEMKMIKVKGLDTTGMLCQSCGAGETKLETD